MRKAIGKSVNPVKTIARIGVFSALAFVSSAFLAIPYPGGGYFSFGDAFILLSSFLFGPFVGASVGMLSGACSDMMLASFAYIPFTLFAKAALGLCAGFAYKVKGKGVKLLLLFAGPALQVLAYLVSYYVFYGVGGMANSYFDLIQSFGCLLLALLLDLGIHKALGKRHIP